MAVFTALEHSDLERLLLDYDIGVLERFEGISSGIENTNYFVHLSSPHAPSSQRVVLTLFERLSAEQLPFYLSLMHHLADRGVPCPAPFLTRKGQLFSTVKGKPAAFVQCLPGRDVSKPGVQHCALIGEALAKAHQAGSDFGLRQPNLRGLAWWKQVVPEILPYLSVTRAALLRDELAAQEAFALSPGYAALPMGPVHADLFRDNVLFDHDTVTGSPVLGGLIDFYFAGTDSWLFDLAVVMNDWTVDESVSSHTAHATASQEEAETLAIFDTHRAEALLAAYTRARKFSEAECAAWPWMLRAAAYRFWVSRLYDWYLPRPAQMLTPKDPYQFEVILRARIAQHQSGIGLL
jgi:homoserine kinase type II